MSINQLPENTAILSKGLGKQYMLGGAEQHYDSFRELLKGIASAPFKKAKKLSGQDQQDMFWALRNVDFEIPVGQVTGVVGRNGAGKSTLLKILSRIVQPTEGKVLVRGRVASLLEVGSGFHPELTGRENIYMNASILGMRRKEVDRKLSDIVEFAEVEKFIDTPVKRYSSGMYVRLAFSVAAHVDPDVLLVDEVLAVGDNKFQQRCIGKLNEIGQQGRTVFFVSHNMGLIQKLCTHSIYLKNGQIDLYDQTEKVIGEYLKDGSQQQGKWLSSSETETLRKIKLINHQHREAPVINYNAGGVVLIDFIARRNDQDYVIAVKIVDPVGREIYETRDIDVVQRKTNIDQEYQAKCEIPKMLLMPGLYYVSVMVRNTKHSYLENIEEASFEFEVSNVGFEKEHNRPGLVSPLVEWSISEKEN